MTNQQMDTPQHLLDETHSGTSHVPSKENSIIDYDVYHHCYDAVLALAIALDKMIEGMF